MRALGEVSLERILDSTQAREAPLNSGLVSYQTVIYRMVYQTYHAVYYRTVISGRYFSRRPLRPAETWGSLGPCTCRLARKRGTYAPNGAVCSSSGWRRSWAAR